MILVQRLKSWKRGCAKTAKLLSKHLLRPLKASCVAWTVSEIGLLCFLSIFDIKCDLFSNIFHFDSFVVQHFSSSRLLLFEIPPSLRLELLGLALVLEGQHFLIKCRGMFASHSNVSSAGMYPYKRTW